MKSLLSLVLCAIIGQSASAATITAIFGSGNPDTGWTTVSGSDGLLLGLRAKDRNTGSTTNAAGVYTFATPLDPNNASRAIFNYEFSISTTAALGTAGYDFYLSADTNSGAGASFLTINALTAYADNSYGSFGVTANGAGVEGTFAALGGSNNLAQNSQNIAFIGMPVNVANATYSYELYAVASGAGAAGTRVATVGITAVVGQGGASVPDSGSSAAMLVLGLGGLAAFCFRRGNAAV